MILCCPNAFLDSLRCSGVTNPLPQHPLAGGHPAALPAHIPFGMLLWEQPGQHSHAGSAGRESAGTPRPAPAPLPAMAGHAAPRCKDMHSCQHELIYIFLKMFLVWDLFKACLPLIPGTMVPAQLMLPARLVTRCVGQHLPHLFAHLGNKVLDKMTHHAL